MQVYEDEYLLYSIENFEANYQRVLEQSASTAEHTIVKQNAEASSAKWPLHFHMFMANAL